jgi:hypothetical protein
LIVALLVVAIVSGPQNETAQSGGGQENSEEEAKGEEKKATSKTKTDPAAVTVGVGETAELRDRTFVVNEVERNYVSPNRFTRVEPGNELIRVYVTLQNTGDQAFNYNVHNFEVQDSGGIQKIPQTIMELPNRIEFGDLAPGGTLEGNMVFEVPEGDNGLSLLYETDIIQKRTIIVKPL